MSTVDAPSQVTYRDVSKVFGTGDRRFTAIEDIDLVVGRGEFVCVVGPSGCGKSTLLNLAAGLMTATDGSVLYENEPLNGPNTKVGYVTQRDTLLPWRTVEANVGLPLEIRGVPHRQRRERVEAMLEVVGLASFGKRYPSQLSGGMLKRAGIAQTLIYNPSTLLMDEPFGALDAQLRLTLQLDLLRLWERDRKTVIFITHDLEEALLMGDKVVVFGSSPGRIIHVENVGWERPRDFAELRGQPQFVEKWERLWKLLSPQLKM